MLTCASRRGCCAKCYGRDLATGRLVEPEDLANAVVWLCSPEAEMVRGQTLIVDGGYSTVA